MGFEHTAMVSRPKRAMFAAIALAALLAVVVGLTSIFAAHANAAELSAPENDIGYIADTVDLSFEKYYYGSGDAASFNFQAVKLDSETAAAAWLEPCVATSSSTGLPDAGEIVGDPVEQTVTVEGGASKAFSLIVPYEGDSENYYLVRELPNGTYDEDSTCYFVRVGASSEGVAAEYCLLYPDANGEFWNYGAVENPDFVTNDADALSLDFKSWKMAGQSAAAERTSVYPTAKVQLNGDDAMLVGGDFAFYLYDVTDGGDGTLLTSTTNDETGNISFFNDSEERGLVFAKPGVYAYEIRQRIPDERGAIAYDSEIAKLSVAVTASEDGSLSVETSYQKDGQVVAVPVFHNTQDVIDLEVQKVSRSDGVGLEGCTYALWMVGSEGQGDVMVQEAVSDSNGRIQFQDVPMQQGRSYYYKEVAAPSGHTINPYRTDYFKLGEDGQTVVSAPEKVLDDVTRVYVNKLDADTHDYVKDAKMAIIRQDTGETVEAWTTDGTTHKSEKQLDVNVTYVLRELEAPSGYSKVDDTVFKINEIEGSGITVLSKDDTTELSGATAQSEGDEDTVSGSYVLTLYDKANAEKERTVKETRGAQTNTTRTTAPKTGDETPIAPIAVLALAGLAAIGVLQLVKRRMA